MQNYVKAATAIVQQSRWLPFLSMLISLFGILVLHWDFQNIIILFVCEVFLMLAFAVLRMFFALSGRPFYETILHKLLYIPAAMLMGVLMIVFSFTFMIDSIKTDRFIFAIRNIQSEIIVLAIGYITRFFMNFIYNQKYKTAVPMMQLGSFFHVLVILGILQGFTGHLLPSFPSLNKAVWGVVALVLVKFLVDFLVTFFQDPYTFFNKKEVPFSGKEYITTSEIDDALHTKTISEHQKNSK